MWTSETYNSPTFRELNSSLSIDPDYFLYPHSSLTPHIWWKLWHFLLSPCVQTWCCGSVMLRDKCSLDSTTAHKLVCNCVMPHGRKSFGCCIQYQWISHYGDSIVAVTSLFLKSYISFCALPSEKCSSEKKNFEIISVSLLWHVLFLSPLGPVPKTYESS